MKTTTTQQEILIFTNTRFSSREWVKKDDNEKNNLSSKEQLKDACWNGLITELLPEICERTYDPSVTLWEINEANSFLALQFGDLNSKLENEFSINPYASMESQHLN
jgi:hypothetical protein